MFQLAKALDDIFLDIEFWEDVRKTIMAAMNPVLREAFLEGAELAAGATPRRAKDELPFNLEAVNIAADQHMLSYQNQFWSRINQTQQDALRAAIARATEQGLGVQAVIDDIEPLFGPERAKLWAVTETTNMVGAGALATYAEAGMNGWEWRTVADARVDRICAARHGQQYPLSTPFIAAHPGCRCWPDPVL